MEFGASLKGNITRLKNFLRGFEKLINNMKKFLREQQKRKQLLLEQQKGDPAAVQSGGQNMRVAKYKKIKKINFI